MAQRLSPAQLNDYWRALFAETGECLVWERSTNPDGYGQKYVAGPTHCVHRLAWEEAHGPIPAGLVVRHRCDNRLCYRLDHLILGTADDNSQDAIERGTMQRGEEHHAAKLTEAAIRAIRASRETNEAAAKLYGVGNSQISKIRRRQSWRHVK